MTDVALLRRTRLLLALVIAGLVFSGLTAFALETELRWLTVTLGIPAEAQSRQYTGLFQWLVRVRNALTDTNSRYPFIAYGTDWLAFAHLVIAVAFIGPWRDPVRNKWVIDFGLITCAGIIPLALIAGQVRDIPLYWRLIDCSFGVVCFVPLWLCRRYVKELEAGAGTERV
jgi:hypothetical protein